MINCFLQRKDKKRQKAQINPIKLLQSRLKCGMIEILWTVQRFAAAVTRKHNDDPLCNRRRLVLQRFIWYGEDMKEYIVKETTDFLALSTLFHSSGMGVKIEERMPERILKMWRMDDRQTGELMAAVTLEVRDGAYALGDIAVRGDLHRQGYGKVMLDAVFEEARALGIKEVWACAKEPTFYMHNGWQKMNWDESPKIAVYCAECPRRDVDCHPQIMHYTLEP